MFVQAARARRPLTLAALLGALALAACADSVTVQDARDALTGKTGEDVLACMGPPTSIKDQGASAVWSYTQKSVIGEAAEVGDPSQMTFQYSPFAANQSPDAAGTGGGLPPAACTVAIGLDQGKVITVDYFGTWGGRMVRSELCGGLVENCVR